MGAKEKIILHTIIFVFAFLLIRSAVAGDYPFTYIAPSRGFDYQYLASLDRLPENSSPAWTNYTYDATQVSMDVSDVTGEPVLRLLHTANNPYALYTLSSTGGSGAHDDLITMDFRFRLRDTTTNGQLSLAVIRPPPPFQLYDGSTESLYWLRFATNNVTTLRDGSYTATNYSFGNHWNDTRLTIDVGRARAKLYVNGSLSPLVEPEEGESDVQQ